MVKTKKLFFFFTLLLLFISTANAAPVTFYKFDGDLTDSAGSNDCTNHGIIYKAGYYNQSCYYNGSTYVTYTAPILDGLSSSSVSAWIYLEKLESNYNYVVIQERESYPTKQVTFLIKNSALRMDYGDGAAGYSVSSYYPFETDTWYNVGFTFDSGEVILYVNGESIKSETVAGTVLETGTPSYKSLGSFTETHFLTGYLDEVQIYNTVLTPSEMADIYDNSIHNAFIISAYDELNETQLNITSFNIYNENQTVSSGTLIEDEYYIYSNKFAESGQYILSIIVDDYHSRKFIVEKNGVPVIVRTYLPAEAETVIYNQFVLNNNIATYNPSDIILRLDKPMPSGTNTIYSSYFDINSITSTYLIPTDAYILYLITPTETINYGWLFADADGETTILLNDFTFEDTSEWLEYTYESSNTSVSFDYTSSKLVQNSSLSVSYANGTEVYASSLEETDTGSFTYNFIANGTYLIDISVNAVDGDSFTKQEYLEIGATNQKDFFPSSYSSTLKSICVIFAMVIGILALSSYRFDLSVIWVFGMYAFSVYQDWIFGNKITVAIIGIIALAAVKKFQKKEKRM